MTPEDVRALTTDSVRRSMASVGDRLQLPGERRAELGGWRDPVTEPLGKGGGAKWKASRELTPLCGWRQVLQPGACAC